MNFSGEAFHLVAGVFVAVVVGLIVVVNGVMLIRYFIAYIGYRRDERRNSKGE